MADQIPKLIADSREKVIKFIPTTRIPSLTMSLTGSSLELDDQDLMSVFSVFGKVNSISIQGNKAIINFEDVVSTFFAHKCLDNKYLPSIGATISLVWRSKNAWENTKRSPLMQSSVSSNNTNQANFSHKP